MSDVTRRQFIKNLSVATAVTTPLFAAPALSLGSKKFEGETLRVFTYAGAWGDMFTNFFGPKFKERTGADVSFDLGWWDAIPKLKATPPGNPPYDLVMTDATQGYPAIKSGLFEPVNFANMPNMKNFDPKMLDNWVVKENWGVTWPDALVTGAYNTNYVKDAPTRWSDLLKPEFDGKLGLYNSFYMSLYTFACMKVDSEGRAGEASKELAENLDGVLAFAKDQAKRVGVWWQSASDMAFNLIEGNVTAGNIHSVGIYAPIKDGQPVQAFVPLEDRAYVQLFWVVPKDTKKKAMAEAAIDFFCSEEFQTDYAKNAGFMTPIQSVAQSMTKVDPLYGVVNPSTDADFEQLGYFPYDTYVKNWDKIAKFWDQEVLRA